MRIDEIYHKHENGTFADFLYSLIKKNSATVASGAFATVIIPNKGNYVYKIWISDKSYEKWIEFCKKNKDHPEYGIILPRFYKNTVVMTAPFTRNSKFANVQLKIQRIEKLKTSERYNHIELEYGNHVFETYEELINFCASSKKYDLDEADIVTDDESVKDDMIAMHALFKNIDISSFGSLDSHSGNYMFRNGRVVLTDIFCDTLPEVILSNISWDGTTYEQMIKQDDEDEDETSNMGLGKVPITIPAYTYSNNDKFVKGRNSKNTSMPILNIIKNNKDDLDKLFDILHPDDIFGEYDLLTSTPS